MMARDDRYKEPEQGICYGELGISLQRLHVQIRSDGIFGYRNTRKS